MIIIDVDEYLENFQVPLFQHMDDLVLENICDRVKSLIFTKGETVSIFKPIYGTKTEIIVLCCYSFR